MKALLFLLLTLAPVKTSWAEFTVEDNPSTVYMGGYNAKSPKSLEDLPAEIRKKVVDHLKTKLGDAFFGRLSLDGGQIVDFDELYRVNPDAKNYEWTVFAYRLHFYFSDKAKGIKSYYPDMEIDSKGGIIKDIELPNIARDLSKGSFISVDQAVEISENQGFSKNKIRTEIKYWEKEDCLAYIITETVSDDGLVIKWDNIAIAAHSGKIIKRYKSEGMR